MNSFNFEPNFKLEWCHAIELLTYFNSMFNFYTPWKKLENHRISVGIEMEHWAKMGQWSLNPGDQKKV